MESWLRSPGAERVWGEACALEEKTSGGGQEMRAASLMARDAGSTFGRA